MSGRVWGVGLEVMRGTFYFVPTIRHEWKNCSCLRWGIVWGNLGLIVFRYCVPSKTEFMEMLEEEEKSEEQT